MDTEKFAALDNICCLYGISASDYEWKLENTFHSILYIGTPIIKKGRCVKFLSNNSKNPEFIDQFPNGNDWNCYCHMETAKIAQEEYDDAREYELSEMRAQMDEDNIREANREFNDMMDDFEAWGNID